MKPYVPPRIPSPAEGVAQGLGAPAEAGRLGAFVRAARERVRPQELGLPQGHRRRTRGLRREEVAALCGISPTWYTWIEQGRTQAVSVATLDALARGLRLSVAERAYLFRLARRADPHAPQPARDARTGEDPAALVRMVRGPAYVLDAYWDVLAWNAAAARLLAPWLANRRAGRAGPAVRRPAPQRRSGSASASSQPPAVMEPNLLRWVYLHVSARRWIVDWESRARRLVAEFRADTAGLREDPRHQSFVAELCAQSPEFDQAWRSQQVLEREGGLRAFATADGVRDYRQFTLRVAGHDELKLIMLQPLTQAAAAAAD